MNSFMVSWNWQQVLNSEIIFSSLQIRKILENGCDYLNP